MGKKLIKCKNCETEMNLKVKKCPNCGVTNKKSILKKWWFWIIILIILGGAFSTGGDNLDTAGNLQNDAIKENEGSNTSNDNNLSSAEVSNDISTLTLGQKNALNSAKAYLNYSAFSYKGLIEQLEYEKYSNEDATYAADNCGADWNKQAVKSAKSYLEYSSFSREGLIEQLEYEGFSYEEAVYGAEEAYGAETTSNVSNNTSGTTIGQKNALDSAKAYLNYSAFSYQGLIKQLEYEQYSSEEATYAADNCGADWNEQATKAAKSYLEYSSFSRDSLIEQLQYEEFTYEQAVYGVEANGY